MLRLARERATKDPAETERLLDRSREELEEALEELRELARGIHPAVLSDRGLGPAVEALAARAPVPVQVLALPKARYPEQVEVAAYYLVTEAVTNAAKYARASGVTVRATRSDGSAGIEVADDGVGGAEVAAGSGLRGLCDRVEALGGRLDISSPPGEGTRLVAHIPLA